MIAVPNTYSQRKSIRLKGYDYSQEGLYFVTICTQGHICLFGEVYQHEMILNEVGEMVEKWYYEIENKFNDIKCHDMVIMPNHIHFIVENNGQVRTDLCVCPNGKDCPDTVDEHIGSPLHRIIQWFKTMTTNEYIRGVKNNEWQPFNKRFWQRNYYEHIIRNENSCNKITDYINLNPSNWKNDKYYN